MCACALAAQLLVSCSQRSAAALSCSEATLLARKEYQFMTTHVVAKQKNDAQSVPILAMHWQSRVKQEFPSVETSLTARHFGQLKLLRRGLGSLTAEVIDWTVNNWWQFSHDAMWKAGLSSRSPTPHIGFLLKHYDVAVNLMYSIAKGTTAKSAADIAFISRVDEMMAEQENQWQEEAAWH
jgi:hypothetical protein